MGLIFWPILASLLFYIAGGPALFVFALSTGIIFLITNKQRIWLSAIPVSLLQPLAERTPRADSATAATAGLSHRFAHESLPGAAP